MAVQARGGWAAQGVKKRCCLPPAVDGLSGPTPAATRPWWGVACTFGAVPASPTVSLLSAGQGPSPGRLAHEPGMGSGPGAGVVLQPRRGWATRRMPRQSLPGSGVDGPDSGRETWTKPDGTTRRSAPKPRHPTSPSWTTVARRALGREWGQKPELDGNAPEGVGAFAPSVPWGDGRRSVRGSFGAPRSRA